jgi:hypothetical protein
MTSSTAYSYSGSYKVPFARLGWVPFAESWNGRLAMAGFLIGIATEALTGHGILSQIGLIG